MIVLCFAARWIGHVIGTPLSSSHWKESTWATTQSAAPPCVVDGPGDSWSSHPQVTWSTSDWSRIESIPTTSYSAMKVCRPAASPNIIDPLTASTVAISVQQQSTPCQTGLSRHLQFLTFWHSDAQGLAEVVRDRVFAEEAKYCVAV